MIYVNGHEVPENGQSLGATVGAFLRQLRNRVDSVVTILLDAESFGGAAGATAAARNLSTTGVQVYIVRQGDELARALDHRVSILHARYV